MRALVIALMIALLPLRGWVGDAMAQAAVAPQVQAAAHEQTAHHDCGLHTASGELYDRLGKDGIADLFCNEKDRTHFSPKGARAMAGMVLKGLADACPALKDIIRPEWQKGEPASQSAQGAAK